MTQRSQRFVSNNRPPLQNPCRNVSLHLQAFIKLTNSSCCSVHPGKPVGYGNTRRSHNRGIVDECCFQSCELRRLEMYCAPAKTSKAARSVRAQRHTDMPRTPKVSTAGHKVDKSTERRTAQQPDKTKNKVSTAPNRYTHQENMEEQQRIDM